MGWLLRLADGAAGSRLTVEEAEVMLTAHREML
jgi:hypothetical protein